MRHGGKRKKQETSPYQIPAAKNRPDLLDVVLNKKNSEATLPSLHPQAVLVPFLMDFQRENKARLPEQGVNVDTKR